MYKGNAVSDTFQMKMFWKGLPSHGSELFTAVTHLAISICLAEWWTGPGLASEKNLKWEFFSNDFVFLHFTELSYWLKFKLRKDLC